jgi:hypothetical protein
MTKPKKRDRKMTENIKEMNDADTVKWFGMFISILPSLLFRSGGAFLRFKLQAKKGGKVFQKELIDQGIDKKTAADLTNSYLEGSEFFKSMMKFR